MSIILKWEKLPDFLSEKWTMLITLKTATKNTGNSVTLLNPRYKRDNLKIQINQQTI